MRWVIPQSAAWLDAMALTFDAEVIEARVIELGPVESALVRARLAAHGDFQPSARALGYIDGDEALADWPRPLGGDDIWIDCAPRGAPAQVLRILDIDGDRWFAASLCSQLLLLTLERLHPGVGWRAAIKDGAWRIANDVTTVPVDSDVLFAAACQVSLCSAYRGDLLGIDAQDLLAWRLGELSQAAGISTRKAHSLFFQALASLSGDADTITVAGVEVLDMVGRERPMIDEAAAFSDQPVLVSDPDNAAVWHLLAANTAVADAFAAEVARAHGLTLLCRNDRQGHSVWLFGGGATVRR